MRLSHADERMLSGDDGPPSKPPSSCSSGTAT
jgi:hypothetical protein